MFDRINKVKRMNSRKILLILSDPIFFVSTPQNTIAIVYDYDQTLGPSDMRDEVVFPAFGIDRRNFWRRCSELVRADGYDSELAARACDY
jgi:hypothetical protein